MAFIKGIANFLVQMQWSIFSVIVLLVIKNPLQKLISHPFSFNVGDKKFNFNQLSQTTFKNNPIPKESDDSLEQLLKEIEKYESEITRSFELEIRNTYKDFKTEDDSKINFLIKILAIIRTRFEFENIYNRIYGSQVELLRYLFSHPQVAEPQVRFYYDGAFKAFSDLYKNYSFDNWANFLITINLIQKNNDLYVITEKGKEFVEYINNQKYGWKLY